MGNRYLHPHPGTPHHHRARPRHPLPTAGIVQQRSGECQLQRRLHPAHRSGCRRAQRRFRESGSNHIDTGFAPGRRILGMARRLSEQMFLHDTGAHRLGQCQCQDLQHRCRQPELMVRHSIDLQLHPHVGRLPQFCIKHRDTRPLSRSRGSERQQRHAGA